MLRVLSLIALVLGALVAGAYIYASALPEEVGAERTRTLNAPVERVFALVTDIAAQPTWRTDILDVTLDDDGRGWTERTKHGVVIAFVEAARSPPTRFEITFSSPQGFSGRWIGVFASTPEGKTDVTFTEIVRTKNPMGRLMQRLFSPPGAHIELYLRDLEAALVTEPQP